MLAKHKISVTQLHMMVFQAQFGTNLAQSILQSVTFKIVSKFNCKSWLAIIDTMKPFDHIYSSDSIAKIRCRRW